MNRFFPTTRLLRTLALAGVLVCAPGSRAEDPPAPPAPPPAPPAATPAAEIGPRDASEVVAGEVPAERRGLEITNNIGDTLPMDLNFLNHDGQIVTLDDVFPDDKPVILVMQYFRCPMLCPLIKQRLAAALNEVDFELGEEYSLVFVSFDHLDTPETASAERGRILKSYNRYEAGTESAASIEDALHVLTGPKRNVRVLADTLGFPYRYLPESGEYSHPSVVYLVTSEGMISRYLVGLEYQPRDIRLGLIDAGEGRVGDVFDGFAAWCFIYDPDSGAYTLEAFRVMQVGSAIIVVVLGTLLGVLWFGERRRRHRRAAAQELNQPEGGTSTKDSPARGPIGPGLSGAST